MKTKVADVRSLDILGNGDRSSDQKVFNAVLKHWWQKLSYCSIFVTVPAMLGSQVAGAQADEPKKPKVNIPGRPTSLLARQNRNRSNLALLKRQSKFLLPHQKGNFAMLAALAGNDDCPGRPIPGGIYTAAAPYIDSGDTTGANNTVTSLLGYYYYYDALGPDHVYSFTLTGLGPNPQIEVSTTSGTYKPLAYILRGDWGPCPAGAGNSVGNVWHTHDSRWFPGTSTATLDISGYPLNVPFLLFVDSGLNDALGSGPYTIKMKDVTIDPAVACPNPNPIDCAGFFITQQYQDFLGRSPEPGSDGTYGTADDPLQFYLNILNGCNPADVECLKYTRGALSANFFRSPEFQRKGSYVMYLYMVSLGQRPVTVAELSDSAKIDRPHYGEFMADLASISTPNDDPVLTETKKNELANAWMQRPEIQQKYGSLSNAAFVQTLLDTAGVTISNQSALVQDLNNGTKTRTQVLRAIVESPEVNSKFFKAAFVTMEYFGYLRRDPEDCHNSANWVGGDPNNCGYIFHNNRFNLSTNADLIENLIVRGFIESPEYRRRFGP